MVRARLEDEGKIKIAGTEIIVDPSFNPYRYAVQVGEIVSCPMKVDRDYIYDTELEVGDRVWLHHFCISQETAQIVNGEILYAVKYRDIYCTMRDGKLMPTQDYVFLTPILEDEANCKTKSGLWLKSTQDVVPLIGRVEAVSPKAAQAELQVGDIVRYLKDSDYDITVEGKKYYRMKEGRIIALMDISQVEN